MTCDNCGIELRVGDWPYCGGKNRHEPLGGGMLGGFKAYDDEDVAPPPSDVFKPINSIPDYHPDKGYRITSLRDRQKLMKLSHADYKN